MKKISRGQSNLAAKYLHTDVKISNESFNSISYSKAFIFTILFNNLIKVPAEINWDEETAAAQNPIVHTEKISFSDIPLVILALYSSEYNTAKY